ncbi:AAA family ATPase [Salinicoccus roseus]|uniref:AAA family ATPase n=1 Tax=Salinicoccus roseus TaxID=45670 RepID=UPI003563B2D6
MNNIAKKFLISKPIFQRIEQLEKISFVSEERFLDDYLPELKKEEFIIKKGREHTLEIEEVSKTKDKLKKEIMDLSKNFTYSIEKTLDDSNIYTKYFDRKEQMFNSIELSTLEDKQKYLLSQFNKYSNKIISDLNTRKDKIDLIINKVERVRNIYKEEIKKFKHTMINSIKLPFFVYTAKILQNYQQGTGIFISTNDKDDAIRFLTDSTSDHDAMHHLSSGQLAVVSLAFTLAINKSYNIAEDLKFLVIDDPIQDLDALNLHSFIELIRHEFLNDYQIILSTYSDEKALFMKYRFESKVDKVDINHVQNIFYS